jgi:hypothetical protein
MPEYKGKHYPYTAEGRARHKRDKEKDRKDGGFSSWLKKKNKKIQGASY